MTAVPFLKSDYYPILLTVRELHTYIIAHERHHRRVLAEKYGL